MGVQGWTRLMAEEGWLPQRQHTQQRSSSNRHHKYNNHNNNDNDNNNNNNNNDDENKESRSCCSTSLWRNPTTMEDSLFASRVRPIPPHSTLHVDGNGLLYYLHSVAYARHLQAVASAANNANNNNNNANNNNNNNNANNHWNGSSSSSSSNVSSNCSNLRATSSLDPAMLRALLPSFMPLQLLADVTAEYVTALVQKQHLTVIVYFDGPRQRTFRPTPIPTAASPQPESKNTSTDADTAATATATLDDGAADTDVAQDIAAADSTDDHVAAVDMDIATANDIVLESQSGTVNAPSFKHETHERRQERFPEEWSAMQQYCLYGVLPAHRQTDDTPTLCAWERRFPKNRLVQTVIRHMLQQCAANGDSNAKNTNNRGLTIVHCQEEADAIMAAAAANDRQSFVVGDDSDFCFFANIQYIPFSTLDASGSVASAVVMRRDELAAALNLPDPDSLVEVAIAMGNDYIPHPGNAALDCPVGAGNVGEILEYIRARGQGFRVTSTDIMMQQVLTFVRASYSLQGGMEEFPFDDQVVATQTATTAASNNETNDNGTGIVNGNGNHDILPILREMDDEAGDEIVTMDQDNQTSTPANTSSRNGGGKIKGIRPAVPSDMDLRLVKLRPMVDFSLGDAVLRCLQTYVDEAAGNEERHSGMMTQQHIDVFRQMQCVDSNSAVIQLLKDPSWRPVWDDIPASYLIERAIATAFALNADSPMMRRFGPSKMFDQYKFHAFLWALRGGGGAAASRLLTPSTLAAPGGLLEDGEIAKEQAPPEPPERVTLPIDEFEDIILEKIRNNRVSIIQGETGCGKSSRIPIMILKAPPPVPALGKVKLFISQPRRIAAKALVERVRSVEPELKDAVALRMGHGVREYESKKTQAWFVTTGYLVRLLINHPEKFNGISHLIIDEVHERSVDTDILCLLCRRLLKTNEHIRLVLMSATLAAAMYQEYFGVPEPPIKVGARRFPVKEVYLEELVKTLALPSKEMKNIQALVKECDLMKGTRAPSMSYMEKLFSVVANIAMVVGRPGSSVLVFVPGMNEIVAITELVDQLFVPGVRYTCFPIHSEIPFEDQMNVFEATAADEVKIIVATNSAESSVTLPDVDHVVCLGLCKQIVYNEASHRQMLLPTWISRASATQRAGRTGRLRPGTVYRMYTRETHDKHMEAFEPGEMLRTPLDSVILMLKEMLSDEDVTAVLLDCLEPPDIATIDRSFQSLFSSHFIDTPDDSCEITTLGKFVSALGIDLTLGSLIGLGIQFGVAAEAIQMAAILSFPKTPWIMSNPLIHESKEYNEITKKSFVSKCHFDANLFSEPLGTMNLLWEFERSKQNQNWCWKHAVAYTRVKRLAGTAVNLRKRVADFIGIHGDLLEVDTPPVHMAHGKITALRVIQAWVLNDTIIYCPPRIAKHGLEEEDPTLVLLPKNGFQVQDTHLQQVLHSERHPFTLNASVKVIQKGSFTMADEGGFSMSAFSPGFEERFLSFAVEREIDLIWFWNEKAITVLAKEDIAGSAGLALVRGQLESVATAESKVTVEEILGDNRRGRAERASGKWTIRKKTDDQHPQDGGTIRVFRRWSLNTPAGLQKKLVKKTSLKIVALAAFLGRCTQSLTDVKRGIGCDFSGSLSSTMNPKFCLVSLGQCSAITQRDVDDLFATFRATAKSSQKSGGKQTVTFHARPNEPISKSLAEKGSIANREKESSWDRPLFDCIPEGARLLTVLASGRRREHAVKVTSSISNGSSDEEEKEVDIKLNSDDTKLSTRWKKDGTDSMVYVNENSVPSSALPVKATEPIYCCCANTLEVKGGGMRAEGLTILPAGRLFLLLCRITFGQFNRKQLEDGRLEETCFQWLAYYKKLQNPKYRPSAIETEEWGRRIRLAVAFHESSIELGEELVCFPDRVQMLQRVFEGVDGHASASWDARSNPFTRENLEVWKLNKMRPKLQQWTDDGVDTTNAEDNSDPNPLSDHDIALEVQQILATTHLDAKSTIAQTPTPKKFKKKMKKNAQSGENPPSASRVSKTKTPTPKKLPRLDVLSATRETSFSSDLLNLSRRLFAVDLPEGDGVDENELPSTNLLAMVVRNFRQSIGTVPEQASGGMSIDGPDWRIYRVMLRDGKEYFHANFSNAGLPFTKPKGSLKNHPDPAWVRSVKPVRPRPDKVSDALDCLPTSFQGAAQIVVGSIGGVQELLFETIEVALRMEAAFWLERQFSTTKEHWYQKDVTYMLARLRAEHWALNKNKLNTK